MHKSPRTKYLLTACIAFSLALATSVFGQGVTTSAITGFISDKTGAPVAGATVTIVHVPSGTRATAVTHSNGQYSVSGLRVGGPYTVTVAAKDAESATQSDIYLGLDHPQTVDLAISSSGVVVLEAYKVQGSKDVTFDSNKMGTSDTYNRAQISQIPTVRRDVQDIAKQDTRFNLTLNTSTGEFSLSAQGQNSRFNSFLIDGQQANDPFGLNANGFSSLRSPIPLDWLAAVTIDLSPYDVTRTGFTGALINAVTKSGTNEYHGDVYTYYTGKSLRASNPGQSATDPNKGVQDALQERTYGFSVGGPIIKDKLFFFLGYEDWKKTGVPASPVIFQPSAAALASVLATAAADGINPGSLVGGIVNSQQKNYLGKLDWNINNDQRATLTYRRTASSAPVYSNGSTYTEFSSNAYQSNRINDNLSFQLNSNWTPDFRTEASLSASKYNGTASLYTPLTPEIYVNGVVGTNLVTGATVTNGQLDIGTNHSYQLNALYTKDYNGHLYGDYSLGDHNLRAGADFDKSINTDIFGQYYTGLYGFASPAAFAAGTPNYARYQQALTGGSGTVAAASYYYSRVDGGLLAQDTWKPSQSLTITAGLRYDYPYYPTRPVYLPAFAAAFGMPNNTTGTGNGTLAPRLGFNYKVPTKLDIQVRGGLGLFEGTNPAVWVGNSYGTTGLLNTVIAGASNASATNPPLGAPYTPFNPSPGYVQGLPPPAVPTPSIAFTDPNFKTPTSWKGNLAFDVKLPWYDLVATAEADVIKVDQAINYQDINLKPTGLFAPDGRILYAGSAGLHPNFSNSVLELTNTDKGGSQAYTFQIARPMKNDWSFAVAYTHTHATEVQPLTSSVASSNYTSRSVYNPNDNIAHNSAYVTPEKYVASATREFHFFQAKNAATRLTGIFRLQTGHAYSWVFNGDANGDGTNGNDSFYVPNGPNDPKVTWSTNANDPTGSIQAANFWSFVNSTDLKKYEGQVVPANSSFNPMQKTVDLHLEQDVPLSNTRLKLSLFFDCLNFANLINKNWGAVTGIDFGTGYSGYNRAVASTTINAAGQYVYTFNSNTQTTPIVFTDLSRWQMQIGAKLEF